MMDDERLVVLPAAALRAAITGINAVTSCLRASNDVLSPGARAAIVVAGHSRVELEAALSLLANEGPDPRTVDQLHVWSTIDEVIGLNAANRAWSHNRKTAALAAAWAALPEAWERWTVDDAARWGVQYIRGLDELERGHQRVLREGPLSSVERDVLQMEAERAEALERAWAHDRG